MKFQSTSSAHNRKSDVYKQVIGPKSHKAAAGTRKNSYCQSKSEIGNEFQTLKFMVVCSILWDTRIVHYCRPFGPAVTRSSMNREI